MLPNPSANTMLHDVPAVSPVMFDPTIVFAMPVVRLVTVFVPIAMFLTPVVIEHIVYAPIAMFAVFVVVPLLAIFSAFTPMAVL